MRCRKQSKKKNSYLNSPIWTTLLSGNDICEDSSTYSLSPATTCTLGASCRSSLNCSLEPKFPVQMTCCILFGTNIRWNSSGITCALFPMWWSPITNTSSPKFAILSRECPYYCRSARVQYKLCAYCASQLLWFKSVVCVVWNILLVL